MDEVYFKQSKYGQRSMKNTSILVVIALWCASLVAIADGVTPRYVAEDGKDEGDCTNMYRPCKSLEFALELAGKVDRVYVAAGQYSLSSADGVYLVGSAAHRIFGSYSRVSGYTQQDAQKHTSTLIGVPPIFRDSLQKAGFKVLADQKHMESEQKHALKQQMQKLSQAYKNHKATPCSGNQASGFSCESVDLQQHLHLSSFGNSVQSANDIWGFYDLNTQREYAVVGLLDRVAIVDVTDPQASEIIDIVTDPASNWRDMKVYQHYDDASQRWHAYAYVSNETSSGLAVLDLTGLPNQVSSVNRGGGINSAHNVFVTNVDPTFGVSLPGVASHVGVAGPNVNGGNFRLYSLATPATPEFVSRSTNGYMHDAASYRITDTRKNTQCVNAQSADVCLVLADFNEDSVDIYDITDPADPQLLSSTQYTSSRYVHSGWWSEDGNHLFVHDELDESNNGTNTIVRVFRVNNVRSPVLVGQWVGPTSSIDHNGYVKGNRYYMSNYTEGLTVLDISDPESPQRVGFFDTVPSTSSSFFSGAWGVYPFLMSDTILISDINTGLYVLKDNTRANAEGLLGFEQSHYALTEGQNMSVAIQRTGGASGEVSVQVELVPLNASLDDVTIASTSFTWSDSDDQAKLLDVSVLADGVAEGIEKFALRLTQPEGGASFSNVSTTIVSISEPDTVAQLDFLSSDLDIKLEKNSAIVTVTRSVNLQQVVSVQASVDYPDSVAAQDFSETLSWDAGDTSAKYIELSLENLGTEDTIMVSLTDAINADIVGSGTASVRYNTAGNGGPSATSTPPPIFSSNGGGGGSLHWLALISLLTLLFSKQRPQKLPNGC